MGTRAPLERLHALLIRLHPSRFRARFGPPSQSLFVEWVSGGATDDEKRSRAQLAVLEACATLLSAWRELLVAPVHRLGRAVLGAGEIGRQGFVAGWRGIRTRPMQTVVVVLTLAIAVGANASLFAVARALLIRALPYEHADRVVIADRGGMVSMSGPREEFESMPGVEVVGQYFDGGSASLTTGDAAARVKLAHVSARFFDALGVHFVRGRALTEDDTGTRSAVIGHALWQDAFAGADDVVGRTLELNGLDYRVVGVASPEVSYPSAAQAWLSLPVESQFFGMAYGAKGLARLASIADRASIEAKMVEESLAESSGEAPPGFSRPSPRLVPLRAHLVRDLSGPLGILAGAASLVFVLGGLNLAGVWTSQVVGRRRELTMRRALGASRLRLCGQLVAETLAVTGLGCVAALAVAALVTEAARTRLPGELPGVSAVGVEPLTILVGFLLSGLMAVGFGGLAAWRGVRLSEARGGRGASQRTHRAQVGLVIAQGALALVLLIGAGLMVRSFQNLASEGLGFEPEHSLSLRIFLPEAEAPDADSRRDYLTELEQALAELPGVWSVGITDLPPLSDGMSGGFSVRRPGQADEREQVAIFSRATTEYFAAAGIPLLAGEPFAESGAERSVVIDAALAEALFGETSPVGELIEFHSWDGEAMAWRPFTVSAVVGSILSGGPRSRPTRRIYMDVRSGPGPTIGIVVRAGGPAGGLLDSVRETVASVNPRVVPFDVRTLDAAVADSLATDRALAAIGSGFSAAAALVAGLGLYGLIAQQVARRRREFGVRLALGAMPNRLILAVVRRAGWLGAAAIGLGVPGTLLGARVLESRLFGIASTDLATIVAGASFVLGMTVVASWIPARSIAFVDPRESLAAE
ncbi:MAG: FtsX-like permease family protein [Acidobacteria bacterium]|nr:FtsX-like permease family protein [Acidobacteriota bacterium]